MSSLTSTAPRTAPRAAALAADYCVGVVGATEKGRLQIHSGGVQAWASRALSCLLEPRAGDTVACMRVAPDEWWVTAVLQREDGQAPHLLSLRGDTTLQIEHGRLAVQAPNLSLRADDALELAASQARLAVETGEVTGRQLRVSAGVLKLVGSVLSSVMDRVQHFSHHYLRRTEGLDRVHATHLDCEAEQLLRLSGEHALVNGEKLVKARGGQIHFG